MLSLHRTCISEDLQKHAVPRFADKEDITDEELRDTADLLEAGQFDANLGGGVFKMRVARIGEGKTGGYRVIVIFMCGHRAFYVEGFAKSQKGNISQREKRNFKTLAKKYLALSDEIIDEAVRTGRFIEI